MTKHHKMSKTRTWASWRQMIRRCHDGARDESRKLYQQRGIKVCSEWHDFLNFLSDMGERPKDMTLERIDNNKGYYKENCKWATAKQQANNRSNSRIINFAGFNKTATQWAEILIYPRFHGVFKTRLSRGWSFLRAIQTPLLESGTDVPVIGRKI